MLAAGLVIFVDNQVKFYALDEEREGDFHAMFLTGHRRSGRL